MTGEIGSHVDAAQWYQNSMGNYDQTHSADVQSKNIKNKILLLLSLFSLCLLLRRRNYFFTYGSLRYLVGLLGRGISPAPRPLPTQDNTTQRNTDIHPCPEQDLNLRPQCSSG
jgi:hypothetical protein